MSLPDTVETQSSDWSQDADAVADAMALATAKTKDLSSAFAATQVDPTPKTPPTSSPKSPSRASGAKSLANTAALEALASSKSKEEALASTKSKEETLAPTKSEEETLAPTKSEEETSNAKPGDKLTPESMLAARKAYADHHGLLLDDVTPDQVTKDAAGAVYWATKNLNLSARSPTAQAMGRSFKHHPNLKELYQTLLDSEKVRFRAAWAATRSWDFVNYERCTTSSYRKRKEELGTFKTQLQIEMILGGDVPEAKRQTQNYISMCLRPDLKAAPHLPLEWQNPIDLYTLKTQILNPSEPPRP